MGSGGNKGQANAGSINFGGSIGTLPLPPNDSSCRIVGSSTPTQARRKPRRTYCSHYGIAQHCRRSNGHCCDGTKTQTARPKSEQTQNEIITLKQATMKEDNMMSYEMYEDFKETMVKAIKTELSAKHNQSTDTDLPQRIEQIVHSEQEQQRAIITQLAERLESIERSNANTHNGIDNLQTSVEAIEIPAELLPRIVQHRISLAIESKGVFWTMIGMMTAIVLLCTMLYWTAKPNYHRIDNDLKYRYIKMKGEATPDRIAELEELFELEPRQRQNPRNEKRCRRI